MESKKRLLLIINPISGTHDKDSVEAMAKARLCDSGFVVDVEWTRAGGDATRLARRAAVDGYYGVIVAGGDGTVNEAARGVIDTPVALGILPCGSGNGLARHIGLKMDMVSALEVIAEDNIVDCDYGTANDRPFICTFGVGFDAAVSERFARQPRRGRMTYIKSAIEEFIHYSPQSYIISLSDGTVLTEKAFLVAVCNASQYGNNAYIAPRASITDGLLDITIIHSGPRLATALVGIDLLTGFIDRNTQIDTLRVDSLTIHRSAEGPVHLDGEPLTFEHTIEVKCHKSSMRLFAPLKDKPFKPIITPMQSFFSDLQSDLRSIINH